MIIPTEPIGSIPRPLRLIEATASGDGTNAALDPLYDEAIRDTIARFEATGSPVITDGEQRKYHNFWTYCVEGLPNTAPDGFKIPFAAGHTRRMLRLTAGPFRYQRHADSYLDVARRYAHLPLKQAVISPSALSLMYPASEIPGYSREQFIRDLLQEHESEVRRCLRKGAHKVQIDFTEGRLAIKLDPSGNLLHSFIDLNNLALSRFSTEERQRIGVHTCPGSDRDSTHSADVDYAELLPSLFQLKAGSFYIALAREKDRTRVLRIIRDHMQPDQRIFVGVIAPIDPCVETPEEVRDRVLEAAEYIPLEQLGTTDDCGFSPFFDDTSTSRDTAFAKIRSRVLGTALAVESTRRCCVKHEDEEDLLRSVALQNAQSIHLVRERAEQELIRANESLERKSEELARSLAQQSRAELAPRESESQLRVVMDHAPVFIVRCDRETRFQFVNRGYAERFGLRPEEIIGKTIAEVLGPEAFAAIRPYVEMALAGQPVDYELEVPYQRLGRRYMHCAYEPERDSAGQVQGFVAVINDITDQKQAEQTKTLLATIVESSQDVIVSKTPDGRILSWNSSAEKLFGYTASEAIGQSIKMIIPPDRQDEEDLILQRLNRGEHIEHYETVRQAKDGRRIDVSLSISPLRDSAGRIVGASKIARDITARKRAEQTTRFLADASAILVELTDYESTLQKVAELAVPSFADWCAVDLQEGDGSVRRLALTHADPVKVQLVHERDRKYPSLPSDPSGVRNVVRTGRSAWAASIPDELLRGLAQSEEHLRTLRELGLKSYICVPLKSRSKALGALTFATAESGRVYDADDLRAAEDLAHRAVIAIENANLLAALKQSDQRKDEFLAMLAHELRNPLAPVRNAVQIFAAKAPPLPELQWAREVIDRQIDQMTRLVDDLLDVSRITRGKIGIRKQIIPLATVMEAAIEASRPLIEKWGHQFTVTVPPEPLYLDADLTRLSQVFLNLLNNAAKYMDEGGHIWFSAERQGDQVVIRVKDTGIGIPTEMLPRIFDVFVQVDRSLERSQGGLGIGLSLVRQLVAMHGGTVEPRSEGSGKGSEFIVTLPLVAEEIQGPSKRDDAGQMDQVPSRRILVVDDNKDAADSLAMLLRLTGDEVLTAYDGLEAVESAFSFRPEVVLLDIGLPKLNGYEAARRIRERVGDRVKLIALTGWGQEDDRRRSQEAGFDDHLTKPVEFEALKTLLAPSASVKR